MKREPVTVHVAVPHDATLDDLVDILMDAPVPPRGHAEREIDRLCTWILANVPHEISRKPDEIAVDTAIRLLEEWMPRDLPTCTDCGGVVERHDGPVTGYFCATCNPEWT